MKNLKIYILLILIAIGFSNCKKILDKVDINGVPDATVWATEGTATLYLNNLYNLVMPVWFSSESASTLPTSIHNTTDDYNGGTTTILTGGLTTETVTDFYTSATNSAYPYIRKINTLFDGVESSTTLTADVKAKLEAQAYFLRAYVYFQLVKLYGGVPYITNTQDYLTDSLNAPRTSTSQCIANMISDLNHCSVLPGKWTNTADFGRITRGAALALKGRILLYWASPQFNPNNDVTRWQAALQANQNAYDTLKMDGYALYSNFYRIALDINNATDKEPILFRSYNGSTTISGLTNNYDNITRPYSQSAGSGGATNNPTWNLVQAFPMKDGKAITDATSAYKYDSVNYWKNRDPRFNQTVAYNGGYWGLGGTSGRKQWTYTGITDDKTKPTTTGFYCRKNIDTSITAINTTYGKCAWVEMRMAEIYLNLAECANATGNKTLAIALVDSIRSRAGIDKGTNGLYGLTIGLTTAQMATVIMNERRVEFAFEGKRYDDLRRTRTFDQLNGTYRNQLAIAPKSPYTVATLEKVLPGGGLARDTINVDVEFSKYFTATVKPLTNESPINFPTLYYFYAIPSSNLGKDPNLFQTSGWGSQNGVFDPLQ